MGIKPVVAYIESIRADHVENSDRTSLTYYLQKCGCEVINYEYGYQLMDDPDIPRFANFGLLVFVVVRQDRYGNDHLEAIKYFRDHVSATIPIAVIPNYYYGCEPFTGLPEYNEIYIHNYYEPAFINFMRRLIRLWQPPLDWLLGGGTKEDQSLLLEQLKTAYSANHPEDNDGIICPVDENTQVVVQSLRVHLLPPELLPDEFDNKIRDNNKTVQMPVVDSRIFDEELDRIRLMNQVARKLFSDNMLRATGKEPHPSGGIIVRSASNGMNCAGFAIDSETLESITIREFGLHHMAADRLVARLVNIEKYRRHGRVDYEMENELEFELDQRVLRGLIISEVKDFETPILELQLPNHISDEAYKNVIEHLLVQKQFIPVDCFGRLHPICGKTQSRVQIETEEEYV